METVEMMPAPQHKVMESVDMTSGSQSQVMEQGKTIPGPICQGTKSSEVISAPLHQVMHCGRVTPVAPLQAMDSTGIIPPAQPYVTESRSLTSGSQLQGRRSVHLVLPPEFQDINTVELTLRPPTEDTKSAELALKPWLQDVRSEKIALVLLIEDVKTPQMVECRWLIPETHVQGMKYGELTKGTLQAVKAAEMSPKPNHQATEPERLTPWHQASESLEMISEPGSQGKEAMLTSDTCHQVEKSIALTQPSLGTTPGPLSQTSESVEMSSVSFQDTLKTTHRLEKAMGETPVSQHTTKESGFDARISRSLWTGQSQTMCGHAETVIQNKMPGTIAYPAISRDRR
uniref:uncharacterized protein LOC100393109 isoform X1 n=1 Tax=Callithrix jacchus TaxID=9483 RepID=UPI0004F04254|nr:uncharacterized protein LOC100393109 isoform X1 [Callithrix jacchus]XP_054101099.1 uncharacterized protein LOC100393109 isoform X1 [Callithrix jacchus]XP_054101100.1 uncharacterized protein LOC100393109 isoform X1 [Callithrix jacchus]XP_054101101.1 uncharacterized protein LOC100393109 isoform X1 [Callithrix jacchus]XP_054101102.1 uncharacterized protein LOC100393109 isoform X1 [Callithrix jacchus]